jgi:hypothetical protein
MRTLSVAERQMNQKDSLENKRYAQIAGDIPKIPANEDESIMIREDEKHRLHVKLITYEAVKGSKENNENVRIKSYDPRVFDRKSVRGAFKVFDKVVVIHDPAKAKEVATKAPKPVNVLIENDKSNGFESDNKTQLDILKEEYKRVTGKTAHYKWDEETIATKILEAQEESEDA